MVTFGTLMKNHKAIRRAKAFSSAEDVTTALNESLEVIYKQLDVAEPVWVSKHARELSAFSRTRFTQEDFLEPVDFDWMEIEFYAD